MANTLTSLVPTLFGAAQEVSRELTGFIAAVDTRFDEQGVAKGDTVSYPVVARKSTSDYTPGMTTSAGADQTVTAVDLTFSNEKKVDWHLTAEQQRSLDNGGDNSIEFMRQNVEQAIRELADGIETLVGGVAKLGASRAVGTAGTTPFATDLGAAVDVRKILRENGAPGTDLSLVIDPSAEANALKLFDPTNSLSGPDITLRQQGIIGSQYTMNWRCSGGVNQHTPGDAASRVTNGVAAVRSLTIGADGGTGTFAAGDVISIADVTDKYVVGSEAGGNITINRPGVFTAIADGKAITAAASYAANVALHRNSIVLAIRPGLQVPNPAIDTEVITDDRTGLSFLFEKIYGDGMITYRVRAVYAAVAVQPEHIALLIG